MKNNYVAKHNHNRCSAHKDQKNDYDRTKSIHGAKAVLVGWDEYKDEEDLVNLTKYSLEENIEVPVEQIYEGFVNSATDIAIKEYSRAK